MKNKKLLKIINPEKSHFLKKTKLNKLSPKLLRRILMVLSVALQ